MQYSGLNLVNKKLRTRAEKCMHIIMLKTVLASEQGRAALDLYNGGTYTLDNVLKVAVT